MVTSGCTLNSPREQCVLSAIAPSCRSRKYLQHRTKPQRPPETPPSDDIYIVHTKRRRQGICIGKINSRSIIQRPPPFPGFYAKHRLKPDTYDFPALRVGSPPNRHPRHGHPPPPDVFRYPALQVELPPHHPRHLPPPDPDPAPG